MKRGKLADLTSRGSRAALFTGGAGRAQRASAERDAARQRVLAVVDSIPAGCVATYGQVAHEAGLPRRARWVGRVLAELEPSSELPWHRVVNASGRISLRPGRGAREQQRRLRREGVAVDPTGRLDLKCCAWNPTAWSSTWQRPRSRRERS